MKTIDFETIDSTNTYLKKHYQEIEDFTFVSAKYQTSGRGRTNRVIRKMEHVRKLTIRTLRHTLNLQAQNLQSIHHLGD